MADMVNQHQTVYVSSILTFAKYLKPTTVIAATKAAAYKYFVMSLRLIIRRLRSI